MTRSTRRLRFFSAIACLTNANQFALQFVFDITPQRRERFSFTEMALYTVERGQVAREEFYYPVA